LRAGCGICPRSAPRPLASLQGHSDREATSTTTLVLLWS
jgi:hypothetical protein